MAEPEEMADIVDNLIETLPRLVEVQQIARRMIKAYPDSVAARVLGEMLALCDEDVISSPGFAQDLKQERERIAK